MGFHELGLWQTASALQLSVSYHDRKVANGSELSVAHVKRAPQVAYKGSETYTLMLMRLLMSSQKTEICKLLLL